MLVLVISCGWVACLYDAFVGLRLVLLVLWLGLGLFGSGVLSWFLIAVALLLGFNVVRLWLVDLVLVA